MQIDPIQLETLLAIAEEGSFDAAARRLHVTPSAISQRVRAAERAAGQVLVRRTSPAELTDAAAPLMRLGRQLRHLTAEAASVMGNEAVVDLAVAVNADSLATWFRPVLATLAEAPATAVRLFVEDESLSHDLLRRGEVLAAVTGEPRPVQGCSVEPLGTMRYVPAATPAFVERHRRGRGFDWSAAPVVVFNEKDRLQDGVLAAHGATRPAVVHRVPSSADFHEAVRCGLGWATIPEPQFDQTGAAGDLVRLPGAKPIGVALHWQRWRLESPALDALTEAVRRAAADVLRRPRRA
ncbi:LysR family transcriptional regulator ArgP [Nocardioides jensenii]|uniref:LysR family transcriptional regulator ArgP n=1 Tax=Nocardioides jensenii TaxID=1843 RepID=UPI0008305858|nr:LysR family transcriptional regulator ArgP [Nocardioides jensenii]